MNRRLLATVLLAVSMAGLLVPSGAYTATSMDRGVTISVAEHEDAVVAIWDPGGPSPEPPQNPGEKPVRSADAPVVVLVVQNRFPGHAVDVRVTARPGSPVDVHGGVADVAPGELANVTATVDCDDRRGRVAVPLELTVVSADGDVTGTVHYTASLVCAGSRDGPSATDAGTQNATIGTPNATAAGTPNATAAGTSTAATVGTSTVATIGTSTATATT